MDKKIIQGVVPASPYIKALVCTPLYDVDRTKQDAVPVDMEVVEVQIIAWEVVAEDEHTWARPVLVQPPGAGGSTVVIKADAKLIEQGPYGRTWNTVLEMRAALLVEAQQRLKKARAEARSPLPGTGR